MYQATKIATSAICAITVAVTSLSTPANAGTVKLAGTWLSNGLKLKFEPLQNGKGAFLAEVEPGATLKGSYQQGDDFGSDYVLNYAHAGRRLLICRYNASPVDGTNTVNLALISQWAPSGETPKFQCPIGTLAPTH